MRTDGTRRAVNEGRGRHRERHAKIGFVIRVLLSVAVLGSTGSLPAAMVSAKAVGEQRVLVIMTRFPDVQPSFSKEIMRAKYCDKLNRYLKAVSYGKTWITAQVTDWYTLPRGVNSYKISMHNLRVRKERVTGLIRDVADLVDKDEDAKRGISISVVGQSAYGLKVRASNAAR